MDYQTILYDVDEFGIARITFNRPDKMNALSWQLLEEMDGALVKSEKDDKVKVIILKGAGRCFSSGFDLTVEPHVGDEPRGRKDPSWKGSLWNCRAHTLGHADYLFRIYDLWKPVISQVHGYCLGGATETATMCDITVISDDCWYGYPPTRYQNVGDVMAHHAWEVGPKKAFELQMGRILTGKECLEWGLATYCFPEEELEAKTAKIAKRIAIMDPELLMLHKSMLHRTLDIMGFRLAEYNSAEYDTFGKARRAMHTSPEWERWNQMKKELGTSKALKKMNEPFGGLKPGPLWDNPL
jgi:enoyl-CoA hydratase